MNKNYEKGYADGFIKALGQAEHHIMNAIEHNNKECPTFEQYKKIVVIINGVRGYSEEALKYDYARIKGHWND